MASRCHSRVWWAGLGPAHLQVVANQNNLRSCRKALPGSSWWTEKCMALFLGSEDADNPSITATPGRACRQSPLPEKNHLSLSLLWTCTKSKERSKTFFSFPVRTCLSSAVPSFFFYSFASHYCPGSLLPLRVVLWSRTDLREANVDWYVLQTRSFGKPQTLLLTLISSCKLA